MSKNIKRYAWLLQVILVFHLALFPLFYISKWLIETTIDENTYTNTGLVLGILISLITIIGMYKLSLFVSNKILSSMNKTVIVASIFSLQSALLFLYNYLGFLF